MSHSQRLGSLAFLSLLILSLAGLASAGEKPNIILVLADDLSARALSCYGGQSVRTPVLDRLASDGMRFTHCYSPPLCMSSRTELLTGKYSHRNYVGRGNVAAGEATIASELGKVGYATCQIEKWHLNIRRGAMPPEAGIDEFYHTKLAHNYADPVVNVNGTEQTFPGGYGPEVCQQFAFDFIRRHRDKPFFLYYAMHLPHAPYHVPPGAGLSEGASNTERYHAMVEHLDLMMGELLEKLDSFNLRERTLLIFTGDNGTPRGIQYRSGGQSLEGQKGKMVDGGTHVPLIIYWPETAPTGVTSDALIDFADFFPTLLDVAEIQSKPGMMLDGHSFHRQLLGGADAPAREWAFKFGCQNAEKGAKPAGGYWARTQRWKLYGDGRFFDMEHDPFEEQPLESESLGVDGTAAHQKLTQVLEQQEAEAVLTRFKKRSAPAPVGEIRKLSTGFRFTEGPAWDGKDSWYFSDLPGKTLHRWTLADGLSTVRTGTEGSSNGITIDSAGRLVFCEVSSRRIVRRSIAGVETTIASSCDGKPIGMPNDVWCAPDGGIYFTIPRTNRQRARVVPADAVSGTVCLISADGRSIRDVGVGLVSPNGIIGSHDGKQLYVADPGAQKCWRFTVQPDGSLSEKRIAADRGSDGLALDEFGNLYITGRDEGILIYSPNAEPIARIRLPERPSNMKFGGPDRRTLFVTARTSIYSVRMNVRGN